MARSLPQAQLEAERQPLPLQPLGGCLEGKILRLHFRQPLFFPKKHFSNAFAVSLIDFYAMFHDVFFLTCAQVS
jgi:hypothetical protein